jgi:hypothetical protein
MVKKIIWAFSEVTTIGLGTYIFVSTIANQDYVDEESAGIGAFLIVLGLLLRNWRTTLFIRETKNEIEREIKPDNQNRTNNALIVFILLFTFFALNRKINTTNSSTEALESEIENLDSRFDDLESELGDIGSIEDRIEDLERYSHHHYY